MTRDAISPELKKLMRRLKLSPMLATLPERLTLARQQHMPHQDSWSWHCPTRWNGATGNPP
jgi:hypothetical protein